MVNCFRCFDNTTVNLYKKEKTTKIFPFYRLYLFATHLSMACNMAMTAANAIFATTFTTSFFTAFTSHYKKKHPFSKGASFSFFTAYYFLNNCNRDKYPPKTKYRCKFFPIKGSRICHEISTL